MFKLLLLIVITMAFSSGFVESSKADPPARNIVAEANIAPSVPSRAFSTNAKVAYYYSRAGVDFSKNVAEFTHPAVGTYCIEPSSNVDLSDHFYPNITIDWGNSEGSNLLFAYWFAYAGDCPIGGLEVVTFGGGGNRSDNVSFVFSLP